MRRLGMMTLAGLLVGTTACSHKPEERKLDSRPALTGSKAAKAPGQAPLTLETYEAELDQVIGLLMLASSRATSAQGLLMANLLKDAKAAELENCKAAGKAMPLMQDLGKLMEADDPRYDNMMKGLDSNERERILKKEGESLYWAQQWQSKSRQLEAMGMTCRTL